MADWGFATPDVLEQIRRITDFWAVKEASADPDDMFQEICLWLSAHPQESIAYLRQAVTFRARDYIYGERKRSRREPVIYDDITYREEM